MPKVIDVCFKEGGRTWYFDPLEFDIKDGDSVIVETARGTEFGTAVRGVHEVEENALVASLKPVLRVATEEDTRLRAKYLAKESEAYAACCAKIEERKMDMKLVSAEYAFNGSKLTFYFTADGRVDFRELVKDLAAVFKTRIELRQIGVRDEARLLGGIGSCGRIICCNAFLTDFQPVSIKMAKEQSLSLSPTKISGICGRLMCCLKYEQDNYEKMIKRMPRVGKPVGTPDGPGIVLENNVLLESTRVKITKSDGTPDVKTYGFRELSFAGNVPQAKLAPEDELAAAIARNSAYAADAPDGDDDGDIPSEDE